ncbi:MAG: right-handed parallel beta-helix repeat-containing protein [Candidatus Omnitrophica bacterium]|nr:right-handed parallel beta-helix repeat-containing protein [Candidatus Omnitrophota bacterium]MCB9781610.1 right-handed parallel beta-helix repeat-containing protein [Candidatus Omnitrophota bacterium]
MRFLVFLIILIFSSPIAYSTVDPLHSNAPNPKAIEKALQSEAKEVNAAWWGFDKEDSTEAIQSAIDSGAKKVVIPYVGDPWIIRPITLASDQEIYFEPGVMTLAKEGEFLGGGDSSFRGTNIKNVKISGYGATIKMRKTDYMSPPYKKAEWRMGISINGSENILIEGVRIESSGGDGIYIGETGQMHYCKDVTIRDVVCHDNHRQGMSVIGAENLLVENCTFSNTWGTAPGAGVDLEPDGPQERLVNCVFRNCEFLNNEGHELLVYPKNLGPDSEPISITFENCLMKNGVREGLVPEEVANPKGYGWAGISLGAMKTEGVKGTVDFINCTVDGAGKECVKIFDKDPDNVQITFTNCNFSDPWLVHHPDYAGYRVPILFEVRRPHLSERIGGVNFIDCEVFDTVFRPVVYLENPHNQNSLEKVSGNLTVISPHEPMVRIGQNPIDVDLEVTQAKWEIEKVEDKPDADAE